MNLPFARLFPFLCVLLALTLPACDKPAEIALAKLERDNFKLNAQDFVRAATLGDEVNVENFITAGMELNSKNQDNYTALMAAAERGHDRTVTLLLNAGTNIDLQGKDGWSALMLASFGNHTEIVQSLVDAGADPDLRDNNGWTALMQAVYQGHDRVVTILAPNSRDGLDRALLIGTMMGHDKVCEILIASGADINAPTEDGETPLMLAAQKGRMESVRMFLDKGAHKSIKNNIGETAEILAQSRGYNEIAILIAEATVAQPDPEPTPVPDSSFLTSNTAPTELDPTIANPVEATPDSTTVAPSTTVATTVATTTEVITTTQETVSRGSGEPQTEWFAKYQLDLNDETMLNADPDADGFTNREEYLSDSNPQDATSRPARAVKLQLADTTDERLPLILDSVSGGSAVIRNTNDNSSHTLTKGDSVPGMPYTVDKVRARAHTDKTSEGQIVDVSEVTLRNTASGTEIILVRGMSTRSGGGNALLYLEGEGQTIKARQGEKFSLPNDDSRQYEVVDIRPDQVVVTEVTTKQVFTINPAN